MANIQKTLTEAHHHLGDLLDLVKQQHAVHIINATRERVAAIMISPEMWEKMQSSNGDGDQADSAEIEVET
jgi:PHD/YefM family antitoxin component YafN of YafNO toxin-antitoxin module